MAELGFKQSPVLLENYLSGQASPSSDALMTGSVPCLPRAPWPVVACPLKARTLSPNLMATRLLLSAFKST